MQQTKNRWLIVLAAIGIHISIGTDEAYYAGYGFFAEGGYLDLFAGDFVLGNFSRLFGNVC